MSFFSKIFGSSSETKKCSPELYINSFGVYAFYPQGLENLVHPDDLEVLRNTAEMRSYGNVYHCIGLGDFYLILEDHLGKIRVKPENFKLVPNPELKIGDLIRLKKKPEKIRKILAIKYHHQNKKIVYQVETENDPLNLTYWFSEQLIIEK